MKKTPLSAAVLCLLLWMAPGADALVIGTFNMEYFSVTGEDRYTPREVEAIAEKIRRSGADVLALQEVADSGSLIYLTTRFLPGWEFRIADTQEDQDLAFLWKKDRVKLEFEPTRFFEDTTYKDPVQGRSALFDRPPLFALFTARDSGFTFGMVNVHLKSGNTAGKADRTAAMAYNVRKRDAQVEGLNGIARELAAVPLFILGDYNDTKVRKAAFPLITLENGNSFDNMQSNIDHIGYANLEKKPFWKLYEVEGSIPSRTFRGREHPDHDLILLKAE